MSAAESSTDIANLALSNIGSGKDIGDLVAENSQEARVCRKYYNAALETVIRDGNWGFTRKTAPLALVEDFRPKVYPIEWNFSYQYPSDALVVRRLLSGNRLDTLGSAVPWQLQYGQSGTLILTDMETPSAEYSVLITVVERFPSDFVLALSHLLSALIAPRLTAGDPLRLGDKAYQKYLTFNSVATKNDAIEGNPDIEHQSDMIRVRD